MRFVKNLFLFVSLFFLSSCFINRQRQVWLGALQQTHQSDTGSVIRVYFDKQGNLYPDKKLFIPYKRFFDPENGEKTIAENPRTGNLEYYYTTNREKLKELFSFYKLDGTLITSAKDSFYAVQQLIRKKLIDSMNVNTGNEPKAVVVMIHGFNDSDPTGDYQLMRNMIRKYGYEKGRFIYLEVYWDGLTTNQGDPVYENIWSRALQNSAYVSLGLRQILTGLDPAIHLHLITHSLGAGVATGALFNVSTKWRLRGFKKPGRKLEQDYGINYFKIQQSLPTPSQNIRLGMFAPAIPGYNSFIDFNNRVPPIPVSENNIHRIVVGFNVNDLAVTKRIWRMDLTRYFGSTSLGCNYEWRGRTELERTKNAFIKNGYSAAMVDQMLKPVDFSLFPRKERPEEHGMYYYLQHTEGVKKFLKEMFE